MRIRTFKVYDKYWPTISSITIIYKHPQIFSILSIGQWPKSWCIEFLLETNPVQLGSQPCEKFIGETWQKSGSIIISAWPFIEINDQKHGGLWLNFSLAFRICIPQFSTTSHSFSWLSKSHFSGRKTAVSCVIILKYRLNFKLAWNRNLRMSLD